MDMLIKKIKNLILILILILIMTLEIIPCSNLDLGIYKIAFNTGNNLQYNEYFV
jgi:hypothetical protein